MRKEPGPPSCSAWNNKKLGETIGADLDVFKLCSALCKGESATTADFAKVKRGSKSLLGTIVSNKRGKLNLPARVNSQAQANNYGSNHYFISIIMMIRPSAHWPGTFMRKMAMT